MKQLIKQWAKEMVSRFTWLTVKYEFSEKLGTYLISFSPSNKIDKSDGFNIEALAFADKMNDEFGDDAPLFTDDENLFSLSYEAEEISYKPSYSDYERVLVNVTTHITTWADSKKKSTKSNSEDFSDWAIAA